MEKQLIQFCETKLLNEQKYPIKKGGEWRSTSNIYFLCFCKNKFKKNKKYIILIHLRVKNTLKYNHYHTFKYPLSTEEMEKHLYHLQVIAMMNNNWEGKKFSSFFISFEAKDGTRNIYKFLEMINQHNRSTVALAF